MNRPLFVTGLFLLLINIVGILLYIGIKAVDWTTLDSLDFAAVVWFVFTIASLFMVVFGAFQN